MSLVRLLLVALVLGTSACEGTYDREVADCPTIAEQHLDGPIDELVEQFPTFPPDLQFQVYICGKQYIKPPMVGLAYLFDESSVPYLGHRLRAANSDLTVRDIVEVFAVISWRGSYDFNNDLALMSLAERRVRGMRSRYWRQFTMERLQEVRSGKRSFERPQ